MKKLLLFFLLLWVSEAYAQNCNQKLYAQLSQEAKQFEGQEKYLECVKKHISALTVCPDQSQAVTAELVRVFQKIDRLKTDALKARTEAETAKKGVLRMLEALAGKTDNYYRFFLHQADSAYRIGEYDIAVRNYQLADNAFDKPAKSLVAKQLADALACQQSQNAAYALLQAGNYEEAEKEIDKAYRLNPTARKTVLIANALNPTKYGLTKVPAGTFLMGCDSTKDSNCGENEKPQHLVSLDAYGIGTYEVTNLAYAVFLNRYGSDKVKEGEYAEQAMLFEDGRGVKKDEKGRWKPADPQADFNPVVYVNWYGAGEFCRFYAGSLPSEAQWEYAARGGKAGFIYAGSDNLDEVGWYESNSLGRTQGVGLLKPNELGIYDISGNVWEWCLDGYDKNFYGTAEAKTKNPINNRAKNYDYRVLRGGSWDYNDFVSRVAYRGDSNPDGRDYYLGFRFGQVL